jgi:hypothetical protein
MVEAELREGTSYDPVGIGGQALGWVPWVGDSLVEGIHIPFLNYCTEGECEIANAPAPPPAPTFWAQCVRRVYANFKGIKKNGQLGITLTARYFYW